MSQPSVTELLFLLGLGLLAWILWYLSQLRETLKDIGADLRSIHSSVLKIEGSTSDFQERDLAAEIRTELEPLFDGTVGIKVAAESRIGGIEALMRAIALESLRKRFKSYSERTGTTKLTLPISENTIKVMGKDMTREDLIEAELRKNGDAIRAEAERRLREVGNSSPID